MSTFIYSTLALLFFGLQVRAVARELSAENIATSSSSTRDCIHACLFGGVSIAFAILAIQ